MKSTEHDAVTREGETAPPPALLVEQQSAEDVYCQRCGYQVFGVESGACPECGARYESNDADTYVLRSGSAIRGRLIVLLIVVWFVLVVALGLSTAFRR